MKDEFIKKIESEFEEVANYFLDDESIFNAPIYVRMTIQGNMLSLSDRLKQADYSSFIQESSLSIQEVHSIIDNITVRMINGVTDRFLDCAKNEEHKDILRNILSHNIPRGSAPGMFSLKDLTEE